MPKRTYFFDVTPEVGLARIQGRDKIDRLDLETIDFHQKVYDGYLKVCEMYPERVMRVDGMQSVEEIVNTITEDILSLIK